MTMKKPKMVQVNRYILAGLLERVRDSAKPLYSVYDRKNKTYVFTVLSQLGHSRRRYSASGYSSVRLPYSWKRASKGAMLSLTVSIAAKLYRWQKSVKRAVPKPSL